MITVYIDGGSRGNPGPAGYGVQIVGDDGAVVAELHGSLAHSTNNVAEYHGLLAALAWAVDHGHKTLHIRSDSELLVKQLRGEYPREEPRPPAALPGRARPCRTYRAGDVRTRAPRVQQGSRPPGQPRDGRGAPPLKLRRTPRAEPEFRRVYNPLMSLRAFVARRWRWSPHRRLPPAPDRLSPIRPPGSSPPSTAAISRAGTGCPRSIRPSSRR